MDTERILASTPIGHQPTGHGSDELPKVLQLFESRGPGMAELLEKVKCAAAADATVLLVGESGTGKYALAQQIHRWSLRSNHPLVVINCTTLAEQLLEDELFGHVCGAFPGAHTDKAGRLEATNGGTVLFEEVADLSPALQTKLLRFAEERSFKRLGTNHTLRVDARIIATSNRNLKAEIAARRFREDL